MVTGEGPSATTTTIPRTTPPPTTTTVVITGASAGVGRATAIAFGRRGYQVGLLARGLEGLETARDEVERAGGRALVLPADVTRPDEVEAAAGRAETELGPIAIWVNCAMATVFAPFDELTPDEYRRVTEVTYLGYVHGTMAALKRMRTRNRGTIVQVGSAVSYHGIPLQSAYSGAKFAIRGFTDALRCELIHDRSRIRLSLVHLPSINTPQFSWSRNRMPRRPHPMPPVYQPEAAAHAIVRAAHEAPRELWVGRQTVQAIVGSIVAPGMLDRMLGQRGFSAQQSDQPTLPDQPDNLFEPVPGLAATHGRFDAQAMPQAMEVVPEAPNIARAFTQASLLGFGMVAMTIGSIARRLP